MARLLATAPALLLLATVAGGAAAADDGGVEFTSFTAAAACGFVQDWYEQLLATREPGELVPLRLEPSDGQLAQLGLPPREFLAGRSFPVPTLVFPTGHREPLDVPSFEQEVGPTLGTVGGAGCLGIRPGSAVLNLNGGIALCSLAHVYGSPGSYDISTAGHCAKNGERMTVIAAAGNRGGLLGVVLLDFGTTRLSHDNGIGDDFALIDIDAAWQGLVSPTMCAWGGPRGVYTKVGSTATLQVIKSNRIRPSLALNPDPLLVQDVVHYGHGLGVGTGGTARTGFDASWGTRHFAFVGAIAPGDSGSGVNTLGGDTVGSTMEAAGIVTHIVVDPLLRTGVGIAAGTRVTQVGTPANGQLVGYPAPAPGLP